MKKQRGEFIATVTTKIYPSSPEEYWVGEIKRENGPVIYVSSRNKKSKTEKEMWEGLKIGRKKSLKQDSNIEKRERCAKMAESQLSYFKDKYGEDSDSRPMILD